MPSRLASALIKLPGTKGDVADVLWRNATVSEIDTPLAVPSDRVVSEMVQLTDGGVTTSFVKNLPHRDNIDVVLRLGPNAAAAQGIADNPVSSAAQLDAVAVTGTAAASAAAARLAADDQDVLDARRFDLMVIDRFVTDGRFDTWANNVVAAGTDIVADTFRRLVVAAPRYADQLVMRALERGIQLDVVMVDRLINASTVVADTGRALLEEAYTTIRSPERLVTPAASRLLSAVGINPRVVKERHSTGTDDTMAMSLRAAGLSDHEIAPLVLGNDTTRLPDGFLVSLLINCGDPLVAQFLGGSSAREPRTGEALALLRAIGPIRAGAVAELLGDSVERAPWAAELLVGLPCRNIDTLGMGSLHELRSLLTEQIGQDTASWEFVCVMSEEWEQTLDSLLAASHQMTTLN